MTTQPGEADKQQAQEPLWKPVPGARGQSSRLMRNGVVVGTVEDTAELLNTLEADNAALREEIEAFRDVLNYNPTRNFEGASALAQELAALRKRAEDAEDSRDGFAADLDHAEEKLERAEAQARALEEERDMWQMSAIESAEVSGEMHAEVNELRTKLGMPSLEDDARELSRKFNAAMREHARVAALSQQPTEGAS